MIKVTTPPKDRKFIAFYIDNYEANAYVCKWDEDIEEFTLEKDTYHGMQWWPVKFTNETIFYTYED